MGTGDMGDGSFTGDLIARRSVQGLGVQGNVEPGNDPSPEGGDIGEVMGDNLLSCWTRLSHSRSLKLGNCRSVGKLSGETDVVSAMNCVGVL